MYSIKIGSHSMIMTIESIAIILHVCTVSYTGLIMCEIWWTGRLICIFCKSGFMFTLPIMVHMGLQVQTGRHLQCCAILLHNHPLRFYMCRHSTLCSNIATCFCLSVLENLTLGVTSFKTPVLCYGWWRHEYQNSGVWAMGVKFMKSNVSG